MLLTRIVAIIRLITVSIFVSEAQWRILTVGMFSLFAYRKLCGLLSLTSPWENVSSHSSHMIHYINIIAVYFNSLLAILNARPPQQKYPSTQSSEERVMTTVFQVDGTGLSSTIASRVSTITLTIFDCHNH